MEKIAVAVVVNPQTADRIQKEIIRQGFVDEITDLFRRLSKAGFKPEVVGDPDPEKTMFSSKIQLPASYFANKQTNEYNMQVFY
jgi:hypothetical protein